MDQAEPILPSTLPPTPLSPLIEAALNAPAIEKRPWEWGAGPFYIGLFLWVVYFDQIPRVSTAEGGVFWSSLGVLIGGILATVVLYRIPAKLGYQTGQGLTIVATSTFGVRGVGWIPGFLQSMTSVVWVAVSTSYAANLCLRALVDLQLIDSQSLTPMILGGRTYPSMLFVVTAFFWSLAACYTGIYLVRVIAALVNVFQILPAVLIGICAARAFGGLSGFHPLPTTSSDPEFQIGLRSMFLAAQMVMGFFAVSGLTSVDWGAASPTERDVSRTGIVGVGFASTIIGVLAILTVAGAIGGQAGRGEAIDPASISFQGALPLLFGPKVTSFLYLIFGLVALAPTCYAANGFGTRMNLSNPRLSKARWTGIGAIAAWLLILAGIPTRLFEVFSLMGAIAGPIIGAMIADQYRASGKWRGPRVGINWAGSFAVAIGFCIAIAPTVAGSLGANAISKLQPATLYGMLASFTVYLLLAKLGLEPPNDDRPEFRVLFEPKPLD